MMCTEHKQPINNIPLIKSELQKAKERCKRLATNLETESGYFFGYLTCIRDIEKLLEGAK